MDECILWTKRLDPSGYGRGPGRRLMHRIVWEGVNGSIPPGMCVLHRCDVRNCINPDHLFLGTQLDNIADMHAKGRHSYASRNVGANNGRAKLTDNDVQMIRTLYRQGGIRQIDLAHRFGIKQPQVSRIVHGEKWKRI